MPSDLVLSKVPIVDHPGRDDGLVILVTFVAEISAGERADARFAVDQTNLPRTIVTSAFEVLRRTIIMSELKKEVVQKRWCVRPSVTYAPRK